MCRNADRFTILSGLFFATWIFAPILSGGRDLAVFGLPLMPGTVLNFISVCALALVQVHYGQLQARRLVVAGMVTKAAIWALVLASLALPEASRIPGYDQVVGSGFRVLVAGLVARYVGDMLVDIPLLQRMKDRGLPFWLCGLVTMLAHNLVNRPIFTLIARWGSGRMGDRLLVQTLAGLILAVLLAPLVAFLNRLVFPEGAPNAVA